MQVEATESAFERQLSSGQMEGQAGCVAFARLTYFCECANLCFESLVVLPLDLKFRLELLDK